jgi:hypothetical protein
MVQIHSTAPIGIIRLTGDLLVGLFFVAKIPVLPSSSLVVDY